MKRGSSGAEFNFLGDRVVKLAPDKSTGERVMNQGLWLQRHHSPAVPKVFQVYARSYVMERLIVPPFWALDHQVVLHHMFASLAEYVWTQPGVVEPNTYSIEMKYARLCQDFALVDLMGKFDTLKDKIDWSALTRCLTHGDPTFDNVMFRSTEYGDDLVIADPIPATPAVPDLYSVDVGKILQSALGWEEVRYGSRSSTPRVGAYKFRAGTMDVQRFVLNNNEWRASCFWAAVHLLRTYPYVTDDVRSKLKERINAAIRLGL